MVGGGAVEFDDVPPIPNAIGHALNVEVFNVREMWPGEFDGAGREGVTGGGEFQRPCLGGGGSGIVPRTGGTESADAVAVRGGECKARVGKVKWCRTFFVDEIPFAVCL